MLRCAGTQAAWEIIAAAVPANDTGAMVPFIADAVTLTRPRHPVLAVSLFDGGGPPFRCVTGELWAVENNINLANMDWTDFARQVGPDGVYRG